MNHSEPPACLELQYFGNLYIIVSYSILWYRIIYYNILWYITVYCAITRWCKISSSKDRNTSVQ